MSGDYQESKHGDEDDSVSIWNDDGGHMSGVGVHHGHKQEYEGPGGVDVEVGGPTIDANVGTWQDKDGVVHHGFKAGGSLYHGKAEKEMGGNMFDVEVEGPGIEAGMDIEEGKVSGELGGGKRAFTPSGPKTAAELTLFKAKAGFASHDKDSDHDRGFHAGIKIGKSLGGEDEESEGLPVHFGTTDKDHDGNKEYHFGTDIPILPGITVSAEYETETPGSDYASSMALGPLGVPLNWGMHMLGLGDYAPGTLLHNATGWVGDKLFGSDEGASPLQMGQLHRATQGLYDQQIKQGVKPEDAERLASVTDPSWKAARDLDRSSENIYETMVKTGQSPEDAEVAAGSMNPQWKAMREADRSSENLYETMLRGGQSPESAARMAQVMNPTWRAPSSPVTARPPAAVAPAAPAQAPSLAPREEQVCRAGDDPFAHYAD